MNLQDIEQNVTNLDPAQGFDFIYDLLRAYGIPKASISRLKKGTHDRSREDHEHLWRGKLYYRFVDDGSDLHALIDDAKNEDRVMRERPRFLIVRDEKQLLAIDTKVETTLDIELSELPAHAAFFLPWAGIEKTQLEALNYADIKAAERMARLYDEIIKYNAITSSSDVHYLNVFFSRLLFCFFAEDTGVFAKGSFTDAIASLTTASGNDTGPFLDRLFKILNTKESQRAGVPAHLRDFGYVNGKLFDQKAPSPQFSAKARKIILECGTLDWSQINPDIFGSMIQVVVHPSQREGLGMHYTSVENIMKVIRPLFLDELEGTFDEAVDSVRKLERLLDRIAAIKVFDPACGSGNFLVISYKELRKLEHRILVRLSDLQVSDRSKAHLFKESKVKLEHFFGIEIDDFAHEIAILSLWLAKHQMNVEFKELFGVEISLIPLRDTGNVVCANAARVSWEIVCPAKSGDEVYLLSNPPYLGARLQSDQQKSDVQELANFGNVSNNLDYVAIWFLLGARYVVNNNAALGFVATNSICQGEQVALLWPHIYRLGADISFGVQSFRWSNSARANAAVICIIVGLRPASAVRKPALYRDDYRQDVESVSPYLTANQRVIVRRTSGLVSRLPRMTFGSMPNDGGHLVLSSVEHSDLIAKVPLARSFIRRFLGAREFINGHDRYVLWITAQEADAAMSIPEIASRIRRVQAYRASSKREATRRLATVPFRFGEIRHQETPSIIVPGVSSERRTYIPIGFLDERTVISNLANAIYGAELWVFGLIQSKMHMVWVRAVGGRLKSDLRYSAELCYNTFPVPELDETAKALLEKQALEVLEAREHYSDWTLGELYDPRTTPEGLSVAHSRLDHAVDHLYRKSKFDSDEERLELLFQMYEALTQTKDRFPIDA